MVRCVIVSVNGRAAGRTTKVDFSIIIGMRTPRPGRASFVDTYAGELDLLSSNLCIVFVLLCEFAGILAATRSLRIGVAGNYQLIRRTSLIDDSLHRFKLVLPRCFRWTLGNPAG